ncbi:MAG: CutA1 divalent ion tolerance protein [Microgenomates group bacterium GW2011_GWC1_46_16]|nr:MAG: CutA1 divalent ion tolerance protein [Microgenomates group bacterium GW2011_GWC1_46_16]KKU28202.1 MAG: CutA1 divalent ion tolerance protein [Microgenomates group bacterium GW2011_GWF2_46_18]KKU43896.1 MAG: CutA1 divalent ion tolerance protein [Microgenomates group bacterium GW2011_GWA1_46_7]KKU45581.1 MAG: CutA1 divalent ion tolerance protein [Microgenomates group bacterium GW2011_GWB1_46_7]KKU61576.1 MAG: CutA1 divalent ion tolerance protein [Microgenomates group bacterium GW2011_GWE1_
MVYYLSMDEVSMKPVFINIPCPTKEEAIKLCTGLLEQELCVTTKIYEHVRLMWLEEKKITGDDVVIMTLKTTDINIPKIHRYMAEHHSWGNPCVEVIPIIADLC